MKPLSIYVHVPFCVRKCAYCDFLSFEGKMDMQGPYVGALNRELQILEEKYEKKFFDEYEVVTIYFGGGTPTSIKPSYICEFLSKIKEKFTVSEYAEITLEANPGTVNGESLRQYKEAGFNRLSFGLQSADNAELNFLSRIHTFEEFRENYSEACEAGFSNINVDIMTALPYQDSHILNKTVDEIMMLPKRPSHISSYSLIVEKGTPFFDKYGELDENGKYTGPEGGFVPTGEKERELYYLVRDRLVNEGYIQYEISNFAHEGYESRHNSAYWTGQDYIGLGLGASSYIDNVRYKNESDLQKYIDDQSGFEEKIVIDKKGQMEEFMFLGLRMLGGVSEYEFRSRFSEDIRNVYGKALDKLISEGLLIYEDRRFYLSDAGVDYGNYCFSQFIS